MTHRVVIVDDEPVDQALFRQGFQRAGSSAVVEVIPQVAVAIEVLQTSPPPALVIVDVRLGIESGLELVEWMRSSDALALTPIIVMSGFDTQEAVDAAYRAGANAFVAKPADVEELDTLMRHIDGFWLREARLPGSDR